MTTLSLPALLDALSLTDQGEGWGVGVVKAVKFCSSKSSVGWASLPAIDAGEEWRAGTPAPLSS